MLIVVKIGTDSVIGNISKIAMDVAMLKKMNCDVILVSSGAVGMGRKTLTKLGRKPVEKQILASIGQVSLMQQYQIEFAEYGLNIGQILITKKDIESAKERDNMENLVLSMLELKNIIPIFNENDSITLQELMFTDNDEIAGMIASQFAADHLIILTNVDGVFDDFTSENRKILSEISPQDELNISQNTSAGGRGGMASKVKTARKLADLGISTTICNIAEINVLARVISGETNSENSLEIQNSPGSVQGFDVNSGDEIYVSKLTYTDIFSQTLIEMAKNDEKVVGITAGMPSGTGLDKFAKIYPERMFDAAIAEQHAVTFAGGMALSGYKPFCAIYSTFLQRCYDQIIHDVAIQNLPVRFMLDRAGYVGADGATHVGAFDIAFLSIIPNMVIMAPSSGKELIGMMKLASSISDKPCSIRYPKGEIPEEIPPSFESVQSVQIGTMRDVFAHKSKICILSFGAILQNVLQAYNLLKTLDGIEVSVVDARFAKPFDRLKIDQLIEAGVEKIVTVEEGCAGGFGAIVSEYLQNKHPNCKISQIHMPDIFIDHGASENIYKIAKLDAKSIANFVKSLNE